MNLLRYVMFFVGLLWGAQLPAFTLTNQAGQSIEVELLQIEAGRVQIRLEQGREMWYPRAQLSEASESALVAQVQAQQNAYQAINQLLGVPLLADNKLWDDVPAEVAQRLDWRRESQTATQSSFRNYPPAKYRVLNARPYSAVLYGAGQASNFISLVFANKGDFKLSESPSSADIRRMEAAIEADAAAIERALSGQLGEPEQQQFGAGRGMKQLVRRWDWQGHAFVLAEEKGEYVSLKIMPTARADNKGRGEKLSDAVLRQMATENITTRSNGDVVISNIPMVNQGPKGYCVPATFERFLRYMQIPADMYLLAMAGQTQIGGGTQVSDLIDSLEGYLGSQGRSMDEMKEEIELRTIQKYIDQGLPLMWAMHSSDDYNAFVNRRSQARRKVKDWEQWSRQSDLDRREVELSPGFFNGHVCMIVGYNRETGEIAVSDSWGPSYTERWVTPEQAQQVSQGFVYRIGY